MTRQEKQALDDAVVQSNYGGGALLAPIEFKANAEDDFLAPVKFSGFANTGRADLGMDIVDPAAFTKSTIDEFLKFGRQLLFMHDRYSQVGEITAANVIKKGSRGPFGIRDGGLKVAGFVDSPMDEFGMIPDHALAKIIHFARMQVAKGRLKLMSIGWRPTKTEIIKAADPRRGGQKLTFRLVKELILGEISLVTMAMNPQSMIELQKAMENVYGDEVAGAMFCEGVSCEDILNKVPEKVEDFTEDNIRRMVVEASQKAALHIERTTLDDDLDQPDTKAETQELKLVTLDDLSKKQTLKLIGLN